MDIGICIQRNIDKEADSLRWILPDVSRELLMKERIL